MQKLKKGKFFVLEGMDGSGKATQTKLLVQALQQKGYKVEKIDFPQYGKVSAGMVENYLKGMYGAAADVGPYRGSIFYAVDRYDLSFKIRQWLSEGTIVVADRYVASNIGHQGGKLIENKKAWKKYIEWLHHLEYELFAIPKPDYTLVLKISAELSMQKSGKITDKEKLKKMKKFLAGGQKKDIHEADRKHLENSLKSYQAISKKYPKEYKIIECEESGNYLPLEVIHKKVLALVQRKLT